MKIGLLTVYYSNYGSYYQAVSLAKQLEELGHECEIINASIRGKYIWKFLLGALGEHVLPKAITDQVAKKVSAFRTYHAMRHELDKLNIGPLTFSPKKLSKRYDCVLVGSDELWSSTNPNIRFIPAYFGLDVDCPIASYATSGITLNNPPEEMERLMEKGINNFSYISVRDKETQGWIKKWTNKDVPIVLDPTLLYPYFGSSGRGGDGIMVYGEYFAPHHVTRIKEFAQKNNYKIHALCWNHPWCNDFLDAESAAELQDFFAKADFCAVSTFHGVIFSLLNHRPFAAFTAPRRTEKITRLLSTLQMENCFWSELCDDEISFKSSYDIFDKNILVLREHSLNCLKEALSAIETDLKKG